MKFVSRIEIHRFRSISDASLIAEDLTIFSGTNNSGKSNVLRALNLFFNGESSFGNPYNFEKDYNIACDKFIEERNAFYNDLNKISYLRIIPSQANFFLCEVIDKFTSSELTDILIAHNVLISNCGQKSNMNGKNIIRIAIRRKEDNEKLIEILRNINNLS